MGSSRHNTEMSMGINRQSMDMRVINERVRLGEWERWVINSFDGIASVSRAWMFVSCCLSKRTASRSRRCRLERYSAGR